MKTENYKFSNVLSGIANSAQRGSTDIRYFTARNRIRTCIIYSFIYCMV